MPITCHWNPESSIWRIRTGATFSLPEVLEMMATTDWKGASRFLWDLRDLQKGPDSSSQLRRAARNVELTQEQWASSRIAALVVRDLDFGIARMFEAYADQIDFEYRVFRDEAEAIAWLEARPEG